MLAVSVLLVRFDGVAEERVPSVKTYLRIEIAIGGPDDSLKVCDIGANVDGSVLAVLAATTDVGLDRLVLVGKEVNWLLNSKPVEVATASAARERPEFVPSQMCQPPSPNQKRKRQTARIDHGSQPTQTKQTSRNRSHVSNVRMLWESRWRINTGNGTDGGIWG
jgi:hypothetical protein